MKRFQRIYSVLFSVCLFVFSVYALLDTFVISRVYAVVETEAADRRASTGLRWMPQGSAVLRSADGARRAAGPKTVRSLRACSRSTLN